MELPWDCGVPMGLIRFSRVLPWDPLGIIVSPGKFMGLTSDFFMGLLWDCSASTRWDFHREYKGLFFYFHETPTTGLAPAILVLEYRTTRMLSCSWCFPVVLPWGLHGIVVLP